MNQIRFLEKSSMLQTQPFLPHFKQRGFVFKYKLIAARQRYEATTISIRKDLFKCTLYHYTTIQI